MAVRTTKSNENLHTRLFIYDHMAITPRRIPFHYVREDIVATTRFGSPVWGYVFTDCKYRAVWSCQYGNEDGEIALSYAKKAGRYESLEDRMNWDLLVFDQTMKEMGVQFESREEHYFAYEEMRLELEKEGIHMKPIPKPLSLLRREKQGENGNKAP